MSNEYQITVDDVIASFKYHGIDLNKYKSELQITSTGGNIYSIPSKPILATTYTFSCTNLLFYNDHFAYLIHMDPAETLGMNNKLEEHITKLKKIILKHQGIGNIINTINILVVLGSSKDDNNKVKFHNLDNVKMHIQHLVSFCHSRKISVRYLPIKRSKFVLFDYRNKALYLENNKTNHFIDVNDLEKNATTLNNVNIPNEEIGRGHLKI